MWHVSQPETTVDLLLGPAPLSGRGLSGGVHVWDHEGGRVFVMTKTDGIVMVQLENDVPISSKKLPFDPAQSWSTPAFDYMNRSLYAIANWKEMWGCNIDGGEPWCAFTAVGFALDAAAGVDGVCVTWNMPHMPWTQSTVHPEPMKPGVSVQQPRFNPDGTSFGYIDDATGIANVRILADEHVSNDVVIEDDCEHGGPTWGPGQRTWCFNTDGTCVAYTRNENGFGSLWVYIRATSRRHRIGQGVHGCLSWEGNTLTALRSGARTPQQVVVYNTQNIEAPVRTILVKPAGEQWAQSDIASELVEPSVHSALVADGEVPYRLYRAATPNHGLIVWVHGGPNDQWQVTFRPRLTYWLSRGWSIVVVDHRGTTGHGRVFTDALNNKWGDIDATDTVAVVQQVQRTFGFRPKRTVLIGGSAGGLTVLNAVSLDASLVAGAVVSYPVVDLSEILVGDDPFETHHMPTLIGSADPNSELVKHRSPLSRADSLGTVPILVFHGDQDESVPLVHSQRLVEAVMKSGGDIHLEVMPGEGHGFRDPLNIIREYDMTEEFLSRCL
jgi:dipeptidyl aminopeptidase/acylaminoacyl peptidase